MYSYKYPHPAVTTDCIIFGFDGAKLKVLLIERGLEPYKGRWAFPGGFLKIDESAEQCAKRELMEETGMVAEYMEQFHALPENDALYKVQYDVKAGHWPENEHQCVVVLTKDGRLYDMTLYSLGLKSGEELDKILDAVADDKTVETSDKLETFDYDDFLGIKLKLVNASDYYVYDNEFSVWKDKSDNDKYIENLVKDGEDLEVVGVVQPKDGEDITMLTAGVSYPASLVNHVIEEASKSKIVKAQIKNKKKNVFNGKAFDDPDDENGLNMEDFFKVDEEAFKNAFKVDTSKMNSNQKVIQHLITIMRKMLVKLVVANGMKKTRHVKSLMIKKEKLVKPMVVNVILKLVHVKNKKKKKKRTKPKKLVQITAELGTEVHVHILLQNQQNLQNLQHLSQRNLVLQEQILPQTTQQAMFGLIEEISTIY